MRYETIHILHCNKLLSRCEGSGRELFLRKNAMLTWTFATCRLRTTREGLRVARVWGLGFSGLGLVSSGLGVKGSLNGTYRPCNAGSLQVIVWALFLNSYSAEFLWPKRPPENMDLTVRVLWNLPCRHPISPKSLSFRFNTLSTASTAALGEFRKWWLSAAGKCCRPAGGPLPQGWRASGLRGLRTEDIRDVPYYVLLCYIILNHTTL